MQELRSFLPVPTRHLIAAGSHHIAYIAPDARLYTWGLGGVGELGNGTTNPQLLPTRVSRPRLIADTELIAVGASDDQTVFITIEGDLYRCGYIEVPNRNGNLSYRVQPTPSQLRMLEPAWSVSVGRYHTAILTEQGRLYIYGCKNDGRLGLGMLRQNVTVPTQVRIPYCIAEVVAGDSHTLALTSGGQVFTWGLNSSGQLGIGNTVNQTTPVPLDLPCSTSKVGAGYAHSALVTMDGQLYTWGYNLWGQLGIGRESQLSPVRITVPELVSDIALGFSHTLILTQAGTVYACGDNQFGELGIGTVEDHSVPVALNLPFQVEMVAATISRSFFISTDRALYVCGFNSHGGLGLGHTRPVLVPTRISIG